MSISELGRSKLDWLKDKIDYLVDAIRTATPPTPCVLGSSADSEDIIVKRPEGLVDKLVNADWQLAAMWGLGISAEVSTQEGEKELSTGHTLASEFFSMSDDEFSFASTGVGRIGEPEGGSAEISTLLHNTSDNTPETAPDKTDDATFHKIHGGLDDILQPTSSVNYDTTNRAADPLDDTDASEAKPGATHNASDAALGAAETAHHLADASNATTHTSNDSGDASDDTGDTADGPDDTSDNTDDDGRGDTSDDADDDDQNDAPDGSSSKISGLKTSDDAQGSDDSDHKSSQTPSLKQIVDENSSHAQDGKAAFHDGVQDRSSLDDDSNDNAHLSSDSGDSFEFGQALGMTLQERGDLMLGDQADANDDVGFGFDATPAWVSHEEGQQTAITHWAHSFVHDTDLLMA